jgi:hypothetical protein
VRWVLLRCGGGQAGSMTRISSQALACEIFKSTRGQWLTRRELSEISGACDVSVASWVDEFVSQGILNCRLRAKAVGASGAAAAEYSLAPEWGGRDAQ